MAKATANPVNFSAEQLAANRAAQRQLHDLLPVLDKAETCGVPVDGYRAIAAGLAQQLQAIEQNFMKDVGS